VPAQSGYPGATLTYTLRLTNTGDAPDTFTLAASGNTWNTQLVTTMTVLAAHAGTNVRLYVTIPPTATNGMTDIVRVTVTGSAGSRATSDLTTTAVAHLIYLPVVHKVP
jgi:uncharacterized membrane protein